jgi:capsid protein
MSQRRLRGWQPPLENINSLIASGGPRLLARSRELVVTNGYAANACEAFASNLVGDGIKPSSLIEDPALRDRVQRLWLAWTDEADADGLTDFYGLQAMLAREMFVAGECFVRLRPRRAEDGLLVPIQLQLLQSEMLPFEKAETAANGNRTIAANIRAEALTHARAVVDLCRLAGQPQMSGRFLERDAGLDEVRAALLAHRAETEPDISAAHPQPGRPSGARPWGDVIARTFRLKG